MLSSPHKPSGPVFPNDHTATADISLSLSHDPTTLAIEVTHELRGGSYNPISYHLSLICSKSSWCFCCLPPSLTSELEVFSFPGTCRLYCGVKELWVTNLSPLLANHD